MEKFTSVTPLVINEDILLLYFFLHSLITPLLPASNETPQPLRVDESMRVQYPPLSLADNVSINVYSRQPNARQDKRNPDNKLTTNIDDR